MKKLYFTIATIIALIPCAIISSIIGEDAFNGILYGFTGMLSLTGVNMIVIYLTKRNGSK